MTKNDDFWGILQKSHRNRDAIRLGISPGKIPDEKSATGWAAGMGEAPHTASPPSLESPLAIFPIGGKVIHKWGRMATYPKLGDSQLFLREERPHEETPHSMRVYVRYQNCPYPWSSGARNLGDEIRGRRGLWPFWAKRPKFTTKWSLQKSYLRITRERSLGVLHGCKPKLCFPFATRVEVQSIMEILLTPQSLKHTIHGKKCIYRRYWHEHIFGSLRNKNMRKYVWSRLIVGAFKYAHYG